MNEAECLREQLDAFRRNFGKLRDEVNKVIVGHGDILDDTLDGPDRRRARAAGRRPGMGKTLTVRTLADALHLKFQRIQFTPDLMPADLIGTNVSWKPPKRKRCQERMALPVVAFEFTSRGGLRLGATIRGGGAWGQGGQRGTGCGQLGRDQVNHAPAHSGSRRTSSRFFRTRVLCPVTP